MPLDCAQVHYPLLFSLPFTIVSSMVQNEGKKRGEQREREKGLFVFNSSNITCLPSWLGQREFVNMLPLVCNDAVAILFMFDLSRKSTLNSIKEWYRQARGFNKVPYLTCRTVQQRLYCHRWLFLHCCTLQSGESSCRHITKRIIAELVSFFYLTL